MEHLWWLPLLIASVQYLEIQKQPPRGVLEQRCSKNMQQIYRRTPMPKCDFNKVAFPLRVRLKDLTQKE